MSNDLSQPGERSIARSLPWASGPLPDLTDAVLRFGWRKHMGWETPFVGVSPHSRGDFHALMSNARSVLVVALPYGGPVDRTPIRWSQSTWGVDYHRVLPPLIRSRLAGMVGERAAAAAHIQVDRGPLEERAVALAMGLGHLGDNAAVHVPPYGPRVFLGVALTEHPLPNVRWVDDDEKPCSDCGRCLEACPTGALVAPHRVLAYRCLSYRTQQRGWLPFVVRRQMGGWLYGCDMCTTVCPQASPSPNLMPLLRPSEADRKPDPQDLIQMSNATFRAQLGDKALAWRGRQLLRRNAVIALGNYGSSEVRESLEGLLQDPSPLIRTHALWALLRLHQRFHIGSTHLLDDMIRIMEFSDPSPEARREAARYRQNLL